jgi:hypothetical protein
MAAACSKVSKAASTPKAILRTEEPSLSTCIPFRDLSLEAKPSISRKPLKNASSFAVVSSALIK